MRNQITGGCHLHHIVDVESVRYGLDMEYFIKIIDVHAVMVSWPWSLDLIRTKRGIELKQNKLPAKIQAIKNLFEGDEDFLLCDGYQSGLGSKGVHSLIISWSEWVMDYFYG